jgi:hypothetical protein
MPESSPTSSKETNPECQESVGSGERKRWCRKEYHRWCVHILSFQFRYARRAIHCIIVNLAFALALRRNDEGRRLCVGILDLDIFGPSIPTLMGLQNNPEPSLTPGKSFSPPFPLTNNDKLIQRSWCDTSSCEPRSPRNVDGFSPSSNPECCRHVDKWTDSRSFRHRHAHSLARLDGPKGRAATLVRC